MRLIPPTLAASILATAPHAIAQTPPAEDNRQLGPVVISEIMYNPASREGGYINEQTNQPVPTKTEWVEIYNPSDQPIDVSGWVLSDEDGATGPLPDGTVLEPKGVLVINPIDCDAATFQAAWGECDVVGVEHWSWDGIENLANSPSDWNEKLRLSDADGHLIDEVNFDDDPPWPGDSPHGPSIYLLPDGLSPDGNDDAIHWARSTEGTDGAIKAEITPVFNGDDFGSPGTVQD
ncbi:MAG: lamin tail domain-containing protein [Planctomycetota bacterium]